MNKSRKFCRWDHWLILSRFLIVPIFYPMSRPLSLSRHQITRTCGLLSAERQPTFSWFSPKSISVERRMLMAQGKCNVGGLGSYSPFDSREIEKIRGHEGRLSSLCGPIREKDIMGLNGLPWRPLTKLNNILHVRDIKKNTLSVRKQRWYWISPWSFLGQGSGHVPNTCLLWRMNLAYNVQNRIKLKN